MKYSKELAESISEQAKVYRELKGTWPIIVADVTDEDADKFNNHEGFIMIALDHYERIQLLYK